MTTRAFVTGSTGFVGLNLVQRLVADGWDVTALHRATSDLTILKTFDARRETGEITDAASLHAAIPEGCDVVYHVAGNTSLWRRRDAEQSRDNVDGTRNVVDACLARGVRRLVVTSSISAYGRVSGTIDESTPSLAAESWINYQRTKYQAEQIARAAVARGLEVVILQPGGIIGRYDLHSWGRMFFLVRDGKVNRLPAGVRTFAHVREVVSAHVAAAHRGENGGAYLLAGANASLLDVVREVSRLLGRPAPVREAPTAFVKVAAQVANLASYVTGREPALTPEMADAFGRTLVTTSAKARRDLGYRVESLETMLADCHAWLVATGRI